MYSHSLADRMKELEFAFQEIEVLSQETDRESTQSELSSDEVMRYRCAVFWAMSYSVFDIIANAANVVHEVVGDERGVSFKLVKNPDWHCAPALVAEATRVRSRAYFKRLDALRNCVLHRRTVYVERHDIVVNEAYLPFDSTDPTRTRTEWLLCDDPYEIPPSTNKRIELLKDCRKIAKHLQDDLVALLKSL